MSRKLVRRRASILVAMVVLVGGSTVGAGSAGALSGGGSVGGDCNPGFSNFVDQQAGDVFVERQISACRPPGGLVDYYTRFTDRGDASAPPVYVTKFVDYPPAGFEIDHVSVFSEDVVNGTESFYPTPVTDPVTGAVTISAEGQGWKMVRNNSGRGLFIVTAYRVPQNAKVGPGPDSGFGFDATGIGTQSWPTMEGSGVEVVSPLSGLGLGFGS